MSGFAARFYDGRQARAREARLVFDEAARTVVLSAEGLDPRVVAWADLRIEPPLGRTARRVWLDALGHVEVEDSPEFRRLASRAAPPGAMGMVSAIESHRGAILAAVGALVLIIVLFLEVGVPAMARSVAFKLPPRTLDYVSEQSLKTLDGVLLAPTKLPAARQRRIREKFAAVARRVPGLPAYRLVFRRFAGGPNAFALPSGTIILTDEMVQFSKSDAELFAVLGHELGHVQHRHGLRLVLQQTGVLLAVSFFLGDVSGSLSAFGALPLALVNNGYSREFEQEADDFGVIFCLRAGLGTRPMTALFTRLMKEYPSGLPAWFSSHPDLAARVERAKSLRTPP